MNKICPKCGNPVWTVCIEIRQDSLPWAAYIDPKNKVHSTTEIPSVHPVFYVDKWCACSDRATVTLQLRGVSRSGKVKMLHIEKGATYADAVGNYGKYCLKKGFRIFRNGFYESDAGHRIEFEMVVKKTGLRK